MTAEKLLEGKKTVVSVGDDMKAKKIVNSHFLAVCSSNIGMYTL